MKKRRELIVRHKDEWVSSVPVSYTHLDVYKRQIVIRQNTVKLNMPLLTVYISVNSIKAIFLMVFKTFVSHLTKYIELNLFICCSQAILFSLQV